MFHGVISSQSYAPSRNSTHIIAPLAFQTSLQLNVKEEVAAIEKQEIHLVITRVGPVGSGEKLESPVDNQDKE